MKKLYSLILVAVILVVCVGCGARSHEHSFGDWETKTPASCENAEVEVRKCECGEEETREGDPATGHTFTSIAAASKMEKPMAGLTVAVSDLSVTATCVCGESVAVTDGIELENATLALGANTVTVKFEDLSTTLDIEAAKLDIAIDGTVTDDTHISSGSKDKENSSKKEMGTKVDEFRAYLRVNVSEIINTDLFTANKDDAKVQLVLPITGGSVADKTNFKLRTFAPAAGATDADFSKLTWNSVDADGTYGALNWGSGTVLLDTGVGHHVSAQNDQITIMLSYNQIADFVDENGNIIFAFATNTDGLKIGSLENKTEANRPTVKIILNDEHFHVFDQEVAESQYFVSAKCNQKAKYYTSCACGAAGTETFSHGGVIGHKYGKPIPEQAKTCTTDGVKEHYRCSRCGKYFLNRDGKMKLVKAEDVKLSAGHDYKLIEAKDPTCTDSGNNKYYKCGNDGCGLYFDADKNETTKEKQSIPKLGHDLGTAIEKVAATCTTDGMEKHYRCSRCPKYFNKDKSPVAMEKLVIPAGHNYVEIAYKEPTCTEAGNNKYYKCGNDGCGLYFDADKNVTTKEDQSIPKLGHDLGTAIEKEAATCTTDGMEKHYRCSRCPKYFNKDKSPVSMEKLVIPALDHDYVEIAYKEPTCTEAGNNKYYKCGNDGCGLYFDADKNETTKEKQSIPKLGHDLGTAIEKVDATCTTDGMEKHYRCSRCPKYFNKDKSPVAMEKLVIPAGHDYVEIAYKEPTCTEAGNNKYYKCGNDGCGLYFDADKNVTTKEDQSIPKLGHDLGTAIEKVDATCTTDGMEKHYRCSRCPKYFNKNKSPVSMEKLVIPALGHTYDPETGKCSCGAEQPVDQP